MAVSPSHPQRRYWGGISAFLCRKVTAVARRCEEDGLYGVLAGQGWGPPWVALAAAAAVTDRLQLGTGIAIAGARSPFETAMAALDMDRISGGRFVLGLGTSTMSTTRDLFGAPPVPPVAHLRETVAAVRHVMRGAHRGLDPFRGTWFRADFSTFRPQPPPVRDAIPIWLGPLGSATTALAGEIADGVLGHPLWGVDWWLGPVQENLRQGLQRSGRPLSALHRCAYFTVVVGSDRRELHSDAAQSIAAYAAIEQYTPFFEAQGFGDVARRIQTLAREGQWTAAVRLVSERMVSALALVGTPDEVGAQIARAWAGTDSMMLSPPVWGLPVERMAVYEKAIAALYRSELR